MNEKQPKQLVDFITKIVGKDSIEYDFGDNINFDFEDSLHGTRKMTSYYHNGSYVLTSHKDDHSNVSYESNFKIFKKKCSFYLMENEKYHLKPMQEAWSRVEDTLMEFIERYGSLKLSACLGRLSKVEKISDHDREMIISTLRLQDSVESARYRFDEMERKAAIKEAEKVKS